MFILYTLYILLTNHKQFCMQNKKRKYKFDVPEIQENMIIDEQD